MDEDIKMLLIILLMNILIKGIISGGELYEDFEILRYEVDNYCEDRGWQEGTWHMKDDYFTCRNTFEINGKELTLESTLPLAKIYR